MHDKRIFGVGSFWLLVDLDARSALHCHPSADCKDDGDVSNGCLMALTGDGCHWRADLMALVAHRIGPRWRPV